MTKPAPIPVPTVTYTQLFSPLAAPSFHSARAAAFTSVSISAGMPSSSRMGGSSGLSLQPGFGVLVIHPYVEDSFFRSTGPKVPIPRDTIPFPLNQSIIAGIVFSGASVGILTCSRSSFCSFPTDRTILVPPASSVPKSMFSSSLSMLIDLSAFIIIIPDPGTFWPEQIVHSGSGCSLCLSGRSP